jgi:hypothetical protein
VEEAEVEVEAVAVEEAEQVRVQELAWELEPVVGSALAQVLGQVLDLVQVQVLVRVRDRGNMEAMVLVTVPAIKE